MKLITLWRNNHEVYETYFTGLILVIFTLSLCIVPALADNGVETETEIIYFEDGSIWL